MSISNTTENAILNAVFRAVAWANYLDNAASSPQTNIHLGLHTADPGDAGTMATSEAGYGSYARVNVARTTGGWSAAAGGSISPAAEISFPQSSGAGSDMGFFSTGKTGGGAADILWSGSVTPPLVVGAAGITPILTTATTITLD